MKQVMTLLAQPLNVIANLGKAKGVVKQMMKTYYLKGRLISRWRADHPPTGR